MASPNRKSNENSKMFDVTKDGEQPAKSPTEKGSLPRYYDSEPSAQPPHYHKAPNSCPDAKRKSAQQQPQFAGASAASVAAILASPSLDPDEKEEKRSWRERWRHFRTSWGGDPENIRGPDYGSSANWNYFGARLDGRQTQRRYLKR